MAVSFGAVVHRLPRRRDRVLAVAYLVGARSENKWFRPGEVRSMFETLRLPAPGNVSEDLSRMASEELVVRHSSGGVWSVTPAGEETVADLVGEVDVAAVEAELRGGGAAELAGVEHPLIPPELAPVRFLPAIRRMLEVSPFERNVFCMTRFPDRDASPGDPLVRTIEAIRQTLAEHGLTLHLASDRQADDELFGNVAAHIWGSKYGIALLETLDSAGEDAQLNDNVLIEVGAMLVSGRRCGLLKDLSAPGPPTDFIAQIYKEVDLGDEAAVRAVITDWAQDDLRVTG